MNTQQFGRSNSPQAQNQHDRSMTDNSELIWDIDPVKSIYLTTIDYSSNERISMKDVLRRYQEDIEEVADINRASDIPQIKKDKKNQKIESCRGKLTIFECSTVLSIEFDNCRSIDKAFDQSPPLFDKDMKLAKRRSGVVTAEKMMKAKLVAVGVRYVQRPHMGRSASDSSKKISLETEVKTIAPKGGGEIILCAGAFESPRILISSGLGVQNSPHKPAELNVKSVAEITDDYSSHASQQTAAKEKTIETIDESQSPSPVPFPSLCAFPPLLPVTLMGIGRNLQDHTVLPIMCVGNWWTVCKNSNKASIRETIIKNIERIQDSNTAEWNYCKNDDTDLVTETGKSFDVVMSR